MNDTIIRTNGALGAALRRHRRLQAMTQSELAEKTGLRQATISKMENGGAIRTDNLMAVIAALGLEFTLGGRSGGDTPALEDIF